MTSENKNQYDHLLIREETNGRFQVKDFKTVKIYEEGNDRLHIYVANPAPFRFYTGMELTVPELKFKLYYPPQNMVKVGHSVTEQNAMLYILGRILANYGHALPAPLVQRIKEEMFNQRQMSLF